MTIPVLRVFVNQNPEFKLINKEQMLIVKPVFIFCIIIITITNSGFLIVKS